MDPSETQKNLNKQKWVKDESDQVAKMCSSKNDRWLSLLGQIRRSRGVARARLITAGCTRGNWSLVPGVTEQAAEEDLIGKMKLPNKLPNKVPEQVAEQGTEKDLVGLVKYPNKLPSKLIAGAGR